MGQARVHLLYGLAGSGKSTLARQLSIDGQAVRFTLDEWMIRLYPGLDFESREYGSAAAEVKELIWSVAAQALLAGVDVVLDWNSWSLARRRWAVEHAEQVGAAVVVHRLSTDLDVASQRALKRTATGQAHSHPVTREGNEHLAGLMEAPNPDAGVHVLEH